MPIVMMAIMERVICPARSTRIVMLNALVLYNPLNKLIGCGAH